MKGLENLSATLKAYASLKQKTAPQIAKRGFGTYIYGKITCEGKYLFCINLTKTNFACDTLLIEGEEMPTQELALISVKEKIKNFFDEVRKDIDEYEVKLNENDSSN
jgi:predicted metal-binding transcription factor (methanogenesis marker protein 9)